MSNKFSRRRGRGEKYRADCYTLETWTGIRKNFWMDREGRWRIRNDTFLSWAEKYGGERNGWIY